MERFDTVFKYVRACHVENRLALFSIAPENGARIGGVRLQESRI